MKPTPSVYSEPASAIYEFRLLPFHESGSHRSAAGRFACQVSEIVFKTQNLTSLVEVEQDGPQRKRVIWCATIGNGKGQILKFNFTTTRA